FVRNMSSVDCLNNGSVDDVIQSVKDCIRKGATSSKGYILSSGDVAPLRIQSFTLCITSSTLPFFKIFTGGTFPTIVKRSPKASRVSPISSQSSTLKEDISNSLKSSQIPLVCPQICKEGLNPVISFIPEVNLFISGKENSINCLWLKISVQVTGSAIDTVAF